MRTEDQVWAVFVESNPIPEVDEGRVKSNGGAAYLMSLHAGEVIEESTAPMVVPPRRRSARLVVTAIVAAIAIGLGVYLIDQSQPQVPPATQLTPSTIAESAPTTFGEVVPTTVTPATLDAVEAAWQELPRFLGRAGGGIQFRTASFFVPFSFTAAEGMWWDAVEDNGRDVFGMNVEAMAAFVEVIPGLESVEATVEALTEWQSNYPDSQMTEPVPTELDSASGVAFALMGLPFEDPAYPAPFTNIFGIARFAGQFSEVHVVDVNGQILIVGHTFAKSFPGQAVPIYTQDEYDTANAAATVVINTIIWKDLN